MLCGRMHPERLCKSSTLVWFYWPELVYMVSYTVLFPRKIFPLYKPVCICALLTAAQFVTWSSETSNVAQFHRLINFRHKFFLGFKSFTEKPNNKYVFPICKLNVNWKSVHKLYHIKNEAWCLLHIFYTWNIKQRPVNTLPSCSIFLSHGLFCCLQGVLKLKHFL